MKTDAEIDAMQRRMDEEGPAVGSLWRHWMGGLYEVVGLALDAGTLAPVVSYRDEAGRRWARSMGDWYAEVGGGLVDSHGFVLPRFRPEPPPEGPSHDDRDC